MSEQQNTQKALLKVAFKASGIGLNIRDEEAEHEYARQHGIDPERIRFTKKILSEPVKPIISEVGKIRRYIKQQTFEGIGNSRLMIAAEADRIRRQVSRHISVANQAVDDLIAQWPAIIAKEREDLNGDFDPDNYPESAEALRTAFAFELEIEPMPDPSQFRLIRELTETEREAMAQRLEAQIQAARANMQAETARRTLDLIKEVSETLGDPDKPIVDSDGRKGCIPKLREHLERLPDLNIEGDDQLANLRSEVLASLDLNSENLRKSKGARARVAFMAENLHKKYERGFGDRAITA